MLIKDPYLQSHIKNYELRSNPQHLYQNTSIQSQPIYSEAQRNRTHSTGQIYDLQAKVSAYERQIKAMQDAYARQGQAARKMLNFNQVNREYHQAMNLRNFQLNTKLKQAANDMHVTRQRYEQDQMRHTYDKDVLLKKYEEQTEELLRLRSSFNCLLQQKTRLEEELSHLSFIIENEAHQHEMQLKQQQIRMQNFEKTYKNLLSAKDEEVNQLVLRLRLYEDENRKLVDINKTLMLTKDRQIDNLSQIHHPESNVKSLIKDRNKQNDDVNFPNSIIKQKNEFKEIKNSNEQMKKQIDELKKQMEEVLSKNQKLQKQKREGHKSDRANESSLLETSKWQGLMSSIMTLREAINNQLFQLFFKSVRDGQRKKQNSLIIFIQNWKCLDMQRLQPYIKSYFEARDNLKEIAGTTLAKQSVHFQKIQEVIPLHVGSRAGRNNINQWILSTIQFTKNQKETSKKSMNNFLLFLFRLLTIEYRIKYPMQGKSYRIDADVSNELMHQIIKAINMIFKYE